MSEENVNLEEVTEVQTENSEEVVVNNFELQGSTLQETMENYIEGTEDPAAPTDENYDLDIKSLGVMVTEVQKTVDVLARLWLETAKAFNITDKINRQIADYNTSHRIPVPPDLSEEEKDNWDYLNGLDQMTMEEAIEIFGEDHPCIKDSIEDTRGCIKDVFGTFFNYAVQKREYENIRSAYLVYVDNEERKQIEEYEKQLEESEDPELKEALEHRISTYYRFKRLEFLREPLSELHLKRIKTGLVDSKKAEYWLGRTQDKLKQLKVNPDFVLMLYHFEEKNLEEKYWKLNNCLLIHFMSLAIYADMHDIREEKMNMVRSMFIAINSIWTRTVKDDDRIAIMANIKAFEDQLLDVIEENPEGTETIHGI